MCKKCVYKTKRDYCKMQHDSLRIAISSLKLYTNCSNAILRVLEATYDVLSTYGCPYTTRLLKRIAWVYNNISPGSVGLYIDERTKLNMLIAELEAFLDD